jgi:hypothetical protein
MYRVSMYYFICHPSDSTVSEDSGIEPRTVATTAMTARRYNNSAKSHPNMQLPNLESTGGRGSGLYSGEISGMKAVDGVYEGPGKLLKNRNIL